MSGKTDQVTGRTKEAIGDLTEDEDLKREGQADQAAGKAKEKVGEASDWVDKKVDEMREKIDRN